MISVHVPATLTMSLDPVRVNLIHSFFLKFPNVMLSLNVVSGGGRGGGRVKGNKIHSYPPDEEDSARVFLQGYCSCKK